MFMAHFAQGQTVEAKEFGIIVIEVRAEKEGVDFFGNFMCNINAICSFSLNDLLISFFPVESFVGVTVRNNGGATSVTDLRGRENLSFGYDEPTESIPLYSLDDNGHIEAAGVLKVRARR